MFWGKTVLLYHCLHPFIARRGPEVLYSYQHVFFAQMWILSSWSSYTASCGSSRWGHVLALLTCNKMKIIADILELSGKVWKIARAMMKIWPWLHYKTTAWRRQTVPSAPLCWNSSPSSWWFAPISCGALNNDNADDESTDDDGEKEDQIEDGGGDGGKRGVLYILYIIYNDCVALIISQGTSECSPITSLLGFLWRETKSLFPVVLRLRSGFGVAAGPPRLDGQVQIYSRSK